MSTYVAHIISSVGDEDVRIYQTDPEDSQEAEHYYWCCEACGACSPHLPTVDSAVSMGAQHEHTTKPEEGNDVPEA